MSPTPTACRCRTLDPPMLRRVIDEAAAEPGFFDRELAAHQDLHAEVSVFVRSATMRAMERVVGAIETTARVPEYVKRALARAPAIAQLDFGPHGAFMGYDFHLDAEEVPRLIEVNTNAGGALFAAAGAKAHRRCCGGPPPPDFEAKVVAMFGAEWRAQRGDLPLAKVAIVDEEPEAQYLYPEFLLVQRLLERHGISTIVAAPHTLDYASGVLSAAGAPVDLVYSRLTDFYLEDEGHGALRAAYEAGDVAMTPTPRHHALYADKRDLTLYTDADVVASWGLDVQARDALATIPLTVDVTPDNADELYAQRKDLFFKPFAGHGSKGVYRGAKLTRRVWATIAAGGYVAQRRVPPTEREVDVDGELRTRKVDLRLYTYRGRTLLAAARVYQGQTTNFRTPGGGFAPLLVAGDCACG